MAPLRVTHQGAKKLGRVPRASPSLVEASLAFPGCPRCWPSRFPRRRVASGGKTQTLGGRNCPVQWQDLSGCQGHVGGVPATSPQRYQGSIHGGFSLKLPLTFDFCLTRFLQPQSSLFLERIWNVHGLVLPVGKAIVILIL